MQERKFPNMPLKPNSSATHLQVKLYYSLGGMNYFTGTNERRGLYLSVTPVTIGDRSIMVTAFSGIKQCLLEMPRFNQKKLDNFEIEADVKQRLIDHVLNKNGIELETEE